MPTKQQMRFVQWDAVIAELETQIAELNTALKTIKRIRDLGVGFGTAVADKATPLPASSRTEPQGHFDDEIRGDAFFNMTIADATVKFLRKWSNRAPQPTKTIIDALAKGGIKGKGYQTVYKALVRRRRQKADVVNVHGDWGLAEWYLENKPPQE